MPAPDASASIPVATSGSYPVRAGNLVQPLIGAQSTYRRIGQAVDEAQHSIWVTIAFYTGDFRFPDDRGGLFDALDRAVARGVDVRLLVWRPNPEVGLRPNMFPGSPDDRAMLAMRGSRVKIRWDRAAGRFCHHQKSWLIDAGRSSETAFVGGTNVTAAAFRHHDVYLEVTGPSATDVHHNFAQRWNEASEREEADGNWACDSVDVLPFPVRASAARGSSTVQISRMLQAGHYADGHPAPGGSSFDVTQGERSIVEQYVRAIDAAKRTIYVENQAIPVMDVAAPLARALDRGVDVVLLVPAIPEGYVYDARLDPNEGPRFEGVEALGRYPNFLMAGIAGRDAQDRHPTYVHAKVMLIDDSWGTIGSCNLHAFSLHGHSEMNASFWDEEVVRRLRCTLLARHLAADTAALDDRRALKLYRKVAMENRRTMDSGDPARAGLAIALSPQNYGVP